MRWKTKIKKPPSDGEFRTVQVFAWLPTQVENNTVWLETYGIREDRIDGVWVEISKHLLHWY
jgi:predicted SnoaL-like aldol condensation-catalyzing enzyme